MEAQHEQVDALLQRIAVLRPEWTRTPSGPRGEELAGLHEELYAGLAEDLEAVETRVLPLVARCITEKEWLALGEAGRKGVARRSMSLVFGMLMQDGDPEVVAMMLAPAPFPVRTLVPRVGRKAYRKHALAIHGTETP
jgi:hypothetical protein